MAEGMRECGLPEDVFQVATGRGGDRRGADRRRRHDHVHRLDRDRQEGHGRARPHDADARVARARRQGPDDRAAPTPTSSAPPTPPSYYSMQNGGQTCISVERVYVEEPVYDEFVAKVAEKVRRAAPGRARPARARSTSARSRSRRSSTSIEDHVEDAVEKGAARARRRPRAATRAGRFYEPTVLVDVDHSMKAMTEETFGPTLPIMKVARRRGGGAAGQRLALRARRVGVDEGHRARRGRSRAGSRPAPCASTTRRSTTSRSSCRWAAGRRPASARATAPAASAPLVCLVDTGGEPRLVVAIFIALRRRPLTFMIGSVGPTSPRSSPSSSGRRR